MTEPTTGAGLASIAEAMRADPIEFARNAAQSWPITPALDPQWCEHSTATLRRRCEIMRVDPDAAVAVAQARAQASRDSYLICCEIVGQALMSADKPRELLTRLKVAVSRPAGEVSGVEIDLVICDEARSAGNWAPIRLPRARMRFAVALCLACMTYVAAYIIEALW